LQSKHGPTIEILPPLIAQGGTQEREHQGHVADVIGDFTSHP
jgi:hypothetical protein